MGKDLRTVAKMPAGTTPFSVRYLEFINAGLDKEVQDAVMFNIIACQQAKGELKTTRVFRHYGEQKMSPQAFEANETIIMQNKADAIVLGKLKDFREHNSLDLCSVGGKWFEYVTTEVEEPEAPAEELAEDEEDVVEFGF